MTRLIILLIALMTGFISCNKTGTIKVNLTKQSAGQPVAVASNDIVLLQNTVDNNDFDGEETSAEGVAIFDEVSNGTYKISAEHWDGAVGIYGETIVEMKNGKDVEVNLLIN